MEEYDAEQFWLRYREYAPKDLPIVVKLDIPQSTLSSWKHKNVFPRADITCKIAEELHTTVEYLVTGKDPKNPVCSQEALEIAVMADKLDDHAIKYLKELAENLIITHHK